MKRPNPDRDSNEPGNKRSKLLTENMGVKEQVENDLEDYPLHLAVHKNDMNQLRILLDINAQNDDGLTALHLAATNGNVDAVKDLIEAGADINAQNNEGCIALHLAAANGHVEAIENFIEAGANIDAQDNEGCSALNWAAANSHFEATKYLIKKGASITNQLLNVTIVKECQHAIIIENQMNEAVKQVSKISEFKNPVKDIIENTFKDLIERLGDPEQAHDDVDPIGAIGGAEQDVVDHH